MHLKQHGGADFTTAKLLHPKIERSTEALLPCKQDQMCVLKLRINCHSLFGGMGHISIALDAL